jgi:transcriptional regulator
VESFTSLFHNIAKTVEASTPPPVDIPQEPRHTPLENQQEIIVPNKSDILQGTLDLIVLKTLETLGPMHGYGVAVRIQQVSENILQLNQGTLYPALVRLEQKGWIASEWGESDNNRRARFYSLTKSGKKQLREETANWERFAGVIERVLNPVN